MTQKETESRPRGRPGVARPKLLEAAIYEFAEKGFAGASTAGIARRAGVPQPLVHHHFKSKELLFDAVLEYLFQELGKDLQAHEGAHNIRVIVRGLVGFTARHPQLLRIWVMESGKNSPHATRIATAFVKPLTDQMIPLVLDAMQRGEIPEMDPGLFLYSVRGLVAYPFLVPDQIHLTHGNPNAPAFIEAYADAVCKILFQKAV